MAKGGRYKSGADLADSPADCYGMCDPEHFRPEFCGSGQEMNFSGCCRKMYRECDVWKDEIDKALKNATIAILLISSDFEASDFITNEELQPLLDKAQADGTKIMPLIVRPCAFFEECGLSKYQAVNDPKKPLSGMTEYEQEMALVDMVKTIKEIIKRPVESGRKEVSDNYVKGTEASEEAVREIVKNWKPDSDKQDS